RAGIRFPVSFELVVLPATSHFQLSFAVEDEPVIEQQLRIHFRDLAALPTPPLETIQLGDRLYSFTARPGKAYQPLKTKEVQNPYQPVFTLLSHAEYGTTLWLQTVCFPLAPSVVQTF